MTRVTRLQGEWRTNTVWLDGMELERSSIRIGDKGFFEWGVCNSGSERLALAILLHFMPGEFVRCLCQAFSQEILSELPQGDFNIEIDIAGWIAKKLAAKNVEERKSRRRRNGSACARRSHGGSRYGTAR